MKGGIFNRPECCNEPCECPVCYEDKPLMRLNCNHYVCLEDIQHIINSNPRRLQKCPICRVLIDNYGCNGNIIQVAPAQGNIYDRVGRPVVDREDDFGHRTPREAARERQLRQYFATVPGSQIPMYIDGGGRKHYKKRKTTKRKTTNYRRKNSKKSKSKKSKR